VRRVLEAMNGTRFSPGQPGLFRPLHDSLLHGGDHYMHLADFESYVATQARAAEEFRQPGTWARKVILTIARMGWFSSDRAITEYARGIWHVDPVVTVPELG
jgi:starch phosphorylase